MQFVMTLQHVTILYLTGVTTGVSIVVAILILTAGV